MDPQLPRQQSDKQHLYEQWAPPEAPWSPWAKPVLFATLTVEQEAAEMVDSVREDEVSWLSAAGDDLALVVDLPGRSSVHWGLAAARYGYRPVPLYNTSPGPSAVVNLTGIMVALCDGGDILDRADLEWTAPPAFLLDRDRLAPGVQRRPGMFDNRWVVFPQDFPSAEFLQSQGINRVEVVQQGKTDLADDLRDVLARWHAKGLAISLRLTDRPDRAESIDPNWSPVSRLRRWLSGLALGLRYNSAGGFGGTVPQPSSAS